MKEKCLLDGFINTMFIFWQLTPLAPITTAADNKFCDIFPNFSKKNKV